MPGAHKPFSAPHAAGRLQGPRRWQLQQYYCCKPASSLLRETGEAPLGKLFNPAEASPQGGKERDLRKLGSPGLPAGSSKCGSEDSWAESCCALAIRRSSALRRLEQSRGKPNEKQKGCPQNSQTIEVPGKHLQHKHTTSQASRRQPQGCYLKQLPPGSYAGMPNI